MPGVDARFVGQRIHSFADAALEIVPVTAGEVGSAYGAVKEQIAAEEGGCLGAVERAMTGAMTGGMPRFKSEIPYMQDLPVFEGTHCGSGRDLKAEERAAAAGLIEFNIIGMEVDGHSFGQGFDEIRHAADVIEVGVGQPNGANLQALFGGGLGDSFAIPGGVDDDGFVGVGIGNNITVGLDRSESEGK